jgi:hypothetical protein
MSEQNSLDRVARPWHTVEAVAEKLDVTVGEVERLVQEGAI